MRRSKAPSSSKVAASSRRAPPASKAAKNAKRVRRSRPELDDELDSGDSGDEEAAQHAALLAGEPDEEEVEESAEERRVRLAKEMIAAMDAAETRRRDAGAGNSGVARGAERDAVREELEEDALRRAGQYRSFVAAKLRGIELDPSATRVLRGPRLSPTCVAIAPDESFVACGCKDTGIVRWDIPTGRRIKLSGGRASMASGSGAAQQTGHLSSVLSLAVSADSRLMVSGGDDCAVRLRMYPAHQPHSSDCCCCCHPLLPSPSSARLAHSSDSTQM